MDSPKLLRRVLLVGSCFVSGWGGILQLIQRQAESDFMQWGPGITLMPEPPRPVADYDFQIVQLPLRAVLPDGSYFRLNYKNLSDYQELFECCKDKVDRYLADMMLWNSKHGILTFVPNFLVPQANPMGRLLPRNDLRNFVYFIEQLNNHLYEAVARFRSAHILDVDSITAVLGRRYMQDDALWPISHGAAIGDLDEAHDQDRLEPIVGIGALYGPKLVEYVEIFWREALAMWRTVHQADAIKLVIFDIDDTLWRGVAAERPEGVYPFMDGWPTGLAETIGHLKRRGIILAIASKNTREVVEKLWPFYFHKNCLSLDDFAIKKINWDSKADNVAQIIKESNLLARNVLFVDDNPVERAAVKAALPEIRTLGGTPYEWRRVLLWSSETQVAQITAESSVRTEMIQAKIERDVARTSMPRDEWLASLELEVRTHCVTAAQDPRYARAFEILNKTNQFNTTGRRWSDAEIVAYLAQGGALFTFEASDKHNNYGLIAVGLVHGQRIDQFVMSCRVVGLDIELAAINKIVESVGGPVEAIAVDNPLNLLSRDLFARCGFVREGDDWARVSAADLVPTPHIALKAEEKKPL